MKKIHITWKKSHTIKQPIVHRFIRILLDIHIQTYSHQHQE